MFKMIATIVSYVIIQGVPLVSIQMVFNNVYGVAELSDHYCLLQWRTHIEMCFQQNGSHVKKQMHDF